MKLLSSPTHCVGTSTSNANCVFFFFGVSLNQCYTYSKRLEGGSNVTVNIVDDILKTCKRRKIKLPPKLNLQLDNTAK